MKKLPLLGVRELEAFLLYELWLKLELFKKNTFEIEVENYSQLIQSELRRLPINLFRSLKVTKSAHFLIKFEITSY